MLVYAMDGSAQTTARAACHTKNSVSYKDQLKGSLGRSIEILKGPFQNFQGPNDAGAILSKAATLTARIFFFFFFFFLTRAVGSRILLASVSDAETWYTSPGQ